MSCVKKMRRWVAPVARFECNELLTNHDDCLTSGTSAEHDRVLSCWWVGWSMRYAQIDGIDSVAGPASIRSIIDAPLRSVVDVEDLPPPESVLVSAGITSRFTADDQAHGSSATAVV